MTAIANGMPSKAAFASGPMAKAVWLWRRIAEIYPWRWALWWFLFPNLVILAMWPIGGPVMQPWLQFSGCLAILLNRARARPVRHFAVPLLLLGTLYFYVLAVFNLGYFSIVYAVSLLLDMHPLESPEYAVAGVIVLFSLALAFVEPPKVPRLEGSVALILAALTVFGVAFADYNLNWATHGSYDRRPPASQEFESAVKANRVDPATLGSRNLVIVLVESLGEPKGGVDAEIVHRLWDRPEWRARYDVRHGTTRYFGSTTNGEIRELCGEYAQFVDYDFSNPNCLPKRFAKAGFQTHAFHSFKGSFFNRELWYPQLGFHDIRFANTLVLQGAESCDGVFTGACDRSVPALIARTLQADHKRHLVYWLTVNAHLPIVASKTLRTDRCTLGPPGWGKSMPMLCRLYEIEQQVSDGLSAQIVSGGFAESDILIVGDHNPPFFQRNIRTRFDFNHVPWIYLEARPASKTAASAR
jgi:sulfatase-like protein